MQTFFSSAGNFPDESNDGLKKKNENQLKIYYRGNEWKIKVACFPLCEKCEEDRIHAILRRTQMNAKLVKS